MPRITSPRFDIVNAQTVKEPVIVLEIEGIEYVFGSSSVNTLIRYDDPGVLYDGTYVYDGLRPLGPLDPEAPKKWIDRKGTKSSMVQKLEQWDGRSSVETLNMRIIDVRAFLTNLISPGFQLNEILNKKVKVWFGYSNLSYKEDFIRLFTGYINEYEAGPGFVNFNFTDPSSKRKQILFNNSSSLLAANIDAVVTTIDVSSTDNFTTTILDAKGNLDPAITLAFRIDDEFITYTNANIASGTQLTGVTRGAFGSVAAAHDINAEVTPVIRISDNAITMALKLMLSGWNSAWQTDVGLRGIVNTDGGSPLTAPNTITFEQGVDLKRDFGIVEGDYIILHDSPNPANNDTWTIASFSNDNRTVTTVETGLVLEAPPTSTLADFRSKYDTYPITAGLALTPDEVFVDRHEYFRNTFLQYVMTFVQEGSEKSGKEFIEKNIMKPLGAYTLNQGAKISMGVTHPPLASQVIPVLDHKNIVEPGAITVKRGLNTRFFYNEVNFLYNWDPVTKEFLNQSRFIDADAQARMKQVSPLQLEARGFGLGDELIFAQRSKRILLRYRYGAETIENVRTFFGTGNTLDPGDVIMLTDAIDPETQRPILQISNTETGDRGIFNRLVEIQERNIDISSGQAKLTLISNLGFSSSDRYATVAPSSEIDTVFSTSKIKIKDSFGAIFPGAEWKKWVDFQGSTIRIHNQSFTDDAETVFTLDESDPYIMNLDPPLPFTPVAGSYYVQFAKYNQTSSLINQRVKQTFCHLDSTATIASGTTDTVFVLDPGFASRYMPAQTVYVVSVDGSRYSNDVKILSIVGDTVTVNKSLGFTPLATDLMQLAGFLDGGAGYRYI